MAKFVPKTQKIKVENGQYVSVLLIIPVVIEIDSHRFEVFTLVLESNENVDLVLGTKTYLSSMVWLIHESCFSFLNRSIPFFPKEHTVLKPGEQRNIKIEATFTKKISWLPIVKMLDLKEQGTDMLKPKYVQNMAILLHDKQYNRQSDI